MERGSGRVFYFSCLKNLTVGWTLAVQVKKSSPLEKSAAGAQKTDSGARFGDVDAFDALADMDLVRLVSAIGRHDDLAVHDNPALRFARMEIDGHRTPDALGEIGHDYVYVEFNPIGSLPNRYLIEAVSLFSGGPIGQHFGFCCDPR